MTTAMAKARWLAIGIAVAVFVALFHNAIFADQNFAFRDAGHFYYPYYKHITQEWAAGRIPLWSPAENGGVPLAANPTACVFYPPKLIFALLPYSQAFKWYHLGHLLLAAFGCYKAARGFDASTLPAAFAGVAYAFGGFVLFQIYNIVFLVGAAWLPLAVLAVDRIVRNQSKLACVGLAVVMAMQVLGGDPELAYLVVVVAGAYALLFDLGPVQGPVAILSVLAVGALAVHRRAFSTIWTWAAAGFEPLRSPDKSERWICLALFILLFAGMLQLLRGRFRKSSSILIPWRTLAFLMVAGSLAGVLSAVQILPTFEFVQHTDRVAPDAPHESAGFSFFPLRVIELLVPSFFGRTFRLDSRWFPFESIETGVWIPDLYMGLLTVVLAIAAMRWFRGNPTEKFLTWLVLLSLWASFGKFGLARFIDSNSFIGLAAQGKQANPVLHNPNGKEQLLLYGETDGLYWILDNCLPGFRSFRYPSKLLVLTSLGLALLSALGLERLARNRSKALSNVLTALAILGLLGASTVWMFGDRFEAKFNNRADRGSFGPLDIVASRRLLTQSLTHAGLVAAAGCLILSIRNRRPNLPENWTCGAFLLVLGVDLAIAQRWQVLLDDQAAVDAVPKVAAIIQAAEATEKDPQPFRVHRTRIFNPLHWHQKASPQRFVEMSRWERNTLQPKYGLPFGLEYTTTVGTMTIYDVEFFFAPWTVPTPENIKAMLPNKAERITYFPRVAFNLWNTKYFVLPKLLKPDDEDRGHITLLGTRDDPACVTLAESSALEDDYVVLKNPECMPRARIVHLADIRQPIVTLSRDQRRPVMEELISRHLDGGAQLWRSPKYPEYRHDSVVMIETDRPDLVGPFIAPTPPGVSEDVRIEKHESNRVVMKAKLANPGFVILADTYYPGWSATVDGKPTELFRANRAMRAVGVPAGEHTIEMHYRCVWFEIGAVISVLASLTTLVVSIGFFRTPVVPSPFAKSIDR